MFQFNINAIASSFGRQPDKRRYNVAIIGRTGAGKSAFINYLYGEKVVKTGNGKPVTENGFHPVEMEIYGLPVTLFDSWGLEVGKHDAWLKELSTELDKRGINQPATEWFHSVFYCIHAGGNRVQECDIDIIKKFIENKYNVSVILTKCDQISEDDKNTMKQTIQEAIPGISVISVCSEEKKTRSGESKPFGKIDVERKAFSDFFDSLINRLPLRCNYVMKKIKKEWLNDINTYINDVSRFSWSDDEIRNKMNERTEKLYKTLTLQVNKEIESTIKMYRDFSKKLGYPPFEADSSVSGSDNFHKKPIDFNLTWYQVPVFTVSLPFMLVYALFVGKSESQAKFLKELNVAESKVDEYINLQTRRIEEKLQELKAKVL